MPVLPNRKTINAVGSLAMLLRVCRRDLCTRTDDSIYVLVLSAALRSKLDQNALDENPPPLPPPPDGIAITRK
eukprot:scaffold7735_cov248-Pinguiococcus_pyrenoidosus.AAC.1